MSVDRTLLATMVREEWRLHVRLFGGWRFAAFPLAVAGLAAAGVGALAYADLDLGLAIAGLHALVFVFGLQTGSVGLVARDALDRLLGEVSLLIGTWRHLPISRARAVGAYLLHDLAYYTVLVLGPLVAGVAVAGLAVEPGLLADVPGLAVSLPATFALGLTTTTALAVLATRGWAGSAGAIAVVVAVVAGWWYGLPVGAATPYGLYADPSLLAIAGTGGLLVLTASVGFAGLGAQSDRSKRTRPPSLEWWADRLGDGNGLTARSLLELSRSAGGVGTVAFSGGLLLAVAAGVVSLVSRIGEVEPRAGLTFGPLLGLAAFTSYNWLTTTTDVPTYRRFPLTAGDVVTATLRALAIVGLPVGACYLVVAVAWLGTTPVDAALGLVLLVGVHTYVGGVTAYLAGMRPNEFLFDTALFAAFGLAVMVPVAPLLVVGLVVPSPGPALLTGVGAAGLALGAVGLLLGRHAAPRWERRYRDGVVD